MESTANVYKEERKQVFCCNYGDEMGVLDLEGRKDGEVLQLAHLLPFSA